MKLEDIGTAMVIAKNFSEMHQAAKNAIDTLGNVRIYSFEDVVTDKELEVLREAEKVLANIRVRTSEWKAQEYATKILSSKQK